jgi:hypothetical protein
MINYNAKYELVYGWIRGLAPCFRCLIMPACSPPPSHRSFSLYPDSCRCLKTEQHLCNEIVSREIAEIPILVSKETFYNIEYYIISCA